MTPQHFPSSSATRERRRRMRAGRALALALLVGAAAQPRAQTPPAVVGVDEVRREPVSQTVPVIGQLIARRSGNVAAQIDGAIADFKVQVGDRVQRADPIALIDDQILVARLGQIEARRDEARARLATSRAQLELAIQERDRLAKLKDTQATSRALYDDAVKSAAIALSRVREAQAAIATAGADLRLAEIDVEHSVVRAPYSGVIVQRLREQGAYVKTGDALVRMLTDTDMEVEADVPFDRLAGLAPGTEVRVVLDAGSEYTAYVRAVVPDENPLTRTRPVRFVPAFGADADGLAQGQSVTVEVPVGAPREAITVHKDGINRRGGGTAVYVVVDGTAKLTPVRLGEPVGSRIEVVEGLAPGDQVIVRGNERLRPDDRVQIRGAPTS